MNMVRNKLHQNCWSLHEATETYISRVSIYSSINRSSEQKYKEAMEVIRIVVAEHKSNLVPGVPQLNMCDRAVMVSY